jgi:hypothetical protein
MIKLSNVDDVRVHTSSVISHPHPPGDSFIRYTINHNLGQIADYTQLFFLGSDDDPYRMYYDFSVYPPTDDRLGWTVREQTENSIQIDIYKVGAGTKDLYFKSIAFGGDHIAST